MFRGYNMKYIKLFEEMIQFNDAHYKEICSDEFDEKTSGCNINDYTQEIGIKYAFEYWESFSHSEVEQINKLLIDHSDDYRYYVDILLSPCLVSTFGDIEGLPKGRLSIKGHPINDQVDNITLFVIKIQDYWYYVYYVDNDEYYVCDQFDGLLNCLENILP
jgi:hypothetical protein